MQQHKTFRYCPKCGAVDFVKKSNKLFICNKCNFNFYMNTAAAVAGIIKDSSGRILMTIRRFAPMAGKLDLPGGFVDANETAEEALIREIREELNLDIKDLKYYKSIPNLYHFKEITYNTLDLIYFCSVKNFENIKVCDDVCGYKFLHVNEIDIDKDVGLNSIKHIIRLLRN
jgi:mutator protein MutT